MNVSFDIVLRVNQASKNKKINIRMNKQPNKSKEWKKKKKKRTESHVRMSQFTRRDALMARLHHKLVRRWCEFGVSECV